MQPNDPMAAYRSLVELCATVREYAGCPAYEQAIAMLDAMEGCYVDDLREVGPDGLVRLQSALRQIGLIRDVLSGKELLPKI